MISFFFLILITISGIAAASSQIGPSSLTACAGQPEFKFARKQAPAASPLDLLDAQDIPAERRGKGQPKELVAVVGRQRKYEGEHIPQAVFAPDGKTLAIRNGHIIDVWKLEGSAFKAHAELEGPSGLRLGGVHDFSADGQYLVCHGALGIKVWEMTAGKPVERTTMGIEEDTGFLWMRLLPTPAGNKLIAPRPDRSVVLNQLKETAAKERTIFSPHTSYITKLELSPDKNTVACSSRDATVRLWDLSGEVPKQKLVLQEGDHVQVVAWSPDGKTLATSGWGKLVQLWDLTAKEPKARIFDGHKHMVRWAAFLPDGKTLVSLAGMPESKESQIFFWQVASGKKLKEWCFAEDLTALTLAPDGRHLAVVSANSMVYIYRLPLLGN
jgi:WD40 repeat protein